MRRCAVLGFWKISHTQSTWRMATHTHSSRSTGAATGTQQRAMCPLRYTVSLRLVILNPRPVCVHCATVPAVYFGLFLSATVWLACMGWLCMRHGATVLYVDISECAQLAGRTCLWNLPCYYAGALQHGQCSFRSKFLLSHRNIQYRNLQAQDGISAHFS